MQIYVPQMLYDHDKIAKNCFQCPPVCYVPVVNEVEPLQARSGGVGVVSETLQAGFKESCVMGNNHREGKVYE